MRSLNIGATGMLAQQTNVDVISNNIANMNTTAYSKRRAEFTDLLYQNVIRPGATSSASQTVVPSGIQLGLGDGAFQRNGDGVIVTHDGYTVQPEITIPDDAVEIYVNSSGEVWVKQDGETDEVNVGQLELAAFPNEAGLEAMGNNLLLETEASGAPILDNPDTEGFGSVLQGYLETSNVNPVSEITELVSAQRAYEMNSKIISTSDQMLSTINQLK